MTTRINLWSCPRNVSTAFMYSWRSRQDTRVYDEPLYAHFLRVTGTKHPGRVESLASMDQDGERVVREVILGNESAPVLFFKQMTHHLVDMDDSFIGKTKNILFIRDPEEIIFSYGKVIAEPIMEDIGVEAQMKLWERWGETGHIHAVLDSKYLLQDPPGILRQLSDRLGIPYDPGMLSWEAGPKPEDGVWAPYWYTNVHRSAGFAPYRKREVVLTPYQTELAQTCKPFYEFLTAKSIR